MSVNPQIPASTANAMLAALNTLASGGFLSLYSGAQPSPGGAALTTQTELVSFALGASAFGTALGGVMAANAIATGIALATGVATWFRLTQSDGVTAILDGSVGTAGCDLNLATTSVTVGDIIGITGFTLSMPLT
jgi:hypothetical protein